MDDASTISADDASDFSGDRELSYLLYDDAQVDNSARSSDGPCSPWWPLRSSRDRSSDAPSLSSKMDTGRDTFMWEEKREKRETELSGRKLT